MKSGLDVLILLCLCFIALPATAQAQPRTKKFIWPLSRLSKPVAPLAATFGPRLNGDNEDSYSFHRGIDIPTKKGTPVYAIADGVVRLAGSYDYYSTPVVQLRHYKNAAKSCKNGGCFYSNYMHLSRVAVTEGKFVKQGELLGFTGENRQGFAHLQLEIRDGGVYQQNCIHPLTVLPYPNRLAPKIYFDTLNTDADTVGSLTITLKAPRAECDLVRADVTVFDTGKQLAQFSYDMVKCNFEYSPKDDPNQLIHQRNLRNVIAKPTLLNDGADYELTLTFAGLEKIVQGKDYQVKVRAIDARGKSLESSKRMRAEAPKITNPGP